MTTQERRTPGPWTIGDAVRKAGDPEPPFAYRIWDRRTGDEVAVIRRKSLEDKERGLRIIRACNTHEALVEAAIEGLRAIEDELSAAGDEEVQQHPTLRSHAKTADQIRAALRLARGEGDEAATTTCPSCEKLHKAAESALFILEDLYTGPECGSAMAEAIHQLKDVLKEPSP